MPKKYATLVHEWFEEVWNQRHAQTIDRLLAAGAIVHGITDEAGKELRGPKAFKKFHNRFLNAFPNLTVEVADTISHGDKIAARCIVRGKHEGDGLGIKATQKETTFTGMCIARVKNGKITEAWNNFDFLTMHTQLGSLAFLSQQQ
jgi:predicted ester cyclase